MTLASSLQSVLESARGIAGSLGLRSFNVFQQTSTNSNGEVFLGYGTTSTIETQLLVGGYSPKVEQVSEKEVLASGGVYTAQDLKVGPFTPDYLTSSELSPTLNAGTSARFRITGPGIPSGSIYQLISTEFGTLHHYLILRKV